VRVVLTGAWGADAQVAGERLAASIHVIAESSLGRLFGLNQPLEAPRVIARQDVLRVDCTLDGMALARGLHDALDAEIGEILAR
jgi:hypothetical protein